MHWHIQQVTRGSYLMTLCDGMVYWVGSVWQKQLYYRGGGTRGSHTGKLVILHDSRPKSVGFLEDGLWVTPKTSESSQDMDSHIGIIHLSISVAFRLYMFVICWKPYSISFQLNNSGQHYWRQTFQYADTQFTEKFNYREVIVCHKCMMHLILGQRNQSHSDIKYKYQQFRRIGSASEHSISIVL